MKSVRSDYFTTQGEPSSLQAGIVSHLVRFEFSVWQAPRDVRLVTAYTIEEVAGSHFIAHLLVVQVADPVQQDAREACVSPLQKKGVPEQFAPGK